VDVDVWMMSRGVLPCDFFDFEVGRVCESVCEVWNQERTRRRVRESEGCGFSGGKGAVFLLGGCIGWNGRCILVCMARYGGSELVFVSDQVETVVMLQMGFCKILAE